MIIMNDDNEDDDDDNDDKDDETSVAVWLGNRRVLPRL
jgi:hypothetical protein